MFLKTALVCHFVDHMLANVLQKETIFVRETDAKDKVSQQVLLGSVEKARQTDLAEVPQKEFMSVMLGMTE